MNQGIHFIIFIVVVFNILITAVSANTQEQAIVPQDQMRIVWQPSGSPFIHNWLICGQFPVPSPTDNGINTDYLADKSGEVNIIPHKAMTHIWSNVEYKWITYDSPTDLVDIAEARLEK